MNHPLSRALRSVGVTTVDVAARLSVDPKTVHRWLAGRVPYPRYRTALADLTGWSTYELWPELPRPIEASSQPDEVRIVYPHRAAVPVDAWSRLFANAKNEICILAYSALFLAEDFTVTETLRRKAETGVRVRIALGNPDGIQIASRGNDEGIGSGMNARIRTAQVGFRPVARAGATLRLHDTVLYNSIYRADNQLLINTHIYGHPGGHAPVLYLCQHATDGMVSTYVDSFERVWRTSHDVTDVA
ncbi:XRE family transcriptional regulator [Actinoplanes sp. NPDC051861]|uniref:XRE family transcriptional regulator n=1 Tax=Actinoplanes sp. NPDC051861 TaxID=3155170 RepID=UPI00341CEB3C